MARARSPNIDKTFEIYNNNDGNIKLINIATELNIKDYQVRKWKSQDRWDDKLKVALLIKEPIAEEVKEVLENAELTDKQRLFYIYYINCFNELKHMDIVLTRKEL